MAAKPKSAVPSKSRAVRGVDAPTPCRLPKTLKPTLAMLVSSIPRDPELWSFETKYDGYRVLTRLEKGSVRLFTRNGHDWSSKLPELVDTLRSMHLKSGWLDGEIVMHADRTGSRFQALQGALEVSSTRQVRYCVFDLPFYDGVDLTQVPLVDRRRLLREVLKGAPATVTFSRELRGSPEELLASACSNNGEGIIGKRRNSVYEFRRSSNWVKLKCHKRQEFVIVGWTDPQGQRSGFGALLLGVHAPDGDLRYAGKVGTGFNGRVLARLRRALDGLATKERPFIEKVPGDHLAHWVKPTLVAEVSFSEWTEKGQLRHPVFRALRSDKPARRIIREQPRPASAGAARSARRTTVAPLAVQVSHPDRVIDPSTGHTKIDVVRHYSAVGSLIMEHLKGRPVSLLRAPDGVSGTVFFQKHPGRRPLPGIAALDRSLDPDHAPLIEVVSPLGLQAAAQMNVIEFHTWNAVKTRIVAPDRMTFDLDPGEGVHWSTMQEAADFLRVMLSELGLPSFLKTSGGKGLHIVTPLRPHHGWSTIKAFAHEIVDHMVRTLPDYFVGKSGPANRVGRIFVDYLRNGFGATTVSAWSLRARPGLGISVPVAWSELGSLKSGNHWTLENIAGRLGRGNAPWKHYARGRKLPDDAMRKLGFRPGN